MRTNEVARTCGVSADTVRYYERRGAIPPAARGANGYRSYTPETVERVRVVRRAIALGFTIEEIACLFRKRAAGKPPCAEVRALAERKLAGLDARIREMIGLREQLATTIADWGARIERAAGKPAYLLDALVSESG